MLDSLPTSFSTPELNVRCAEGEPHRVTDALQRLAAPALAAAATAPRRTDTRVLHTGRTSRRTQVPIAAEAPPTEK